jgi:hypothetical protein
MAGSCFPLIYFLWDVNSCMWNVPEGVSYSFPSVTQIGIRGLHICFPVRLYGTGMLSQRPIICHISEPDLINPYYRHEFLHINFIVILLNFAYIYQ